MSAEPGRRRVAIVGTGIAGLAAAHRLHPHCDLTLYEAGVRPGGHTNTVPVSCPEGLLHVDTGFIVCNDRTYPTFLGLLKELDVPTQPSDMSFSVQCARTGLEYGGESFRALFARKRNLIDPGFWLMLRDILRFRTESKSLLSDESNRQPLGDYLTANGYGRRFTDQFIVPMGAAIWSADPAGFLASFPARFFAIFFANHGFLDADRPTWRTVAGGSERYVQAITKPFAHRIRRQAPVTSVRRHADRVEVAVRGEAPQAFDEVVLACHSDQALSLLADPSPAESQILGAIRYQPNEAVLHTDRRMLPRRRAVWASWNVHLPRDPLGRVAMTYYMNRLQSLRTRETVCVTLNRSAEIDAAKVLKRIQYHHPVFDHAAWDAQRRHAEVSGVRRTHYCGAYWGWGFHEDGAVSGLKAAAGLLAGMGKGAA